MGIYMTHHDIERLAAWPLCRLFRARKVWRRSGNHDLAALADQAIERRYEMFRLGSVS